MPTTDRPPREQAVTFRAGSIPLDGRVAVPPRPSAAVVICHPHPQYGGDMDNRVVTGLAAILHRLAGAHHFLAGTEAAIGHAVEDFLRHGTPEGST